MATKLRRFFSNPNRIQDITPLIIPPLNLGGNLGEVREACRKRVSDDGVWVKAEGEAAKRINTSGGLQRCMGNLPFTQEKPKQANTINLGEGLSLHTIKMIFKSGVVGFNLQFGKSVLARASLDPFYDDNPHFKGAEMYVTVAPELQGLGITGRLGDFMEKLLYDVGFGYVVALPSHPATCADVAHRGYLPIRRDVSTVLGKALFGQDGSIFFSLDTKKNREVHRVLEESSHVSGRERRRDFYARRFSEVLFRKVESDGRVDYVPEYYFMRQLREPPTVGGLDAEVLWGRRLTWDDYQEELKTKKRLNEGKTSDNLEQDLRDRLRQELLRRKGIA